MTAAHHHANAEIGAVEFLRLPDVKRLTKLSRASIYRRIADDDFPSPTHIGSRISVWVASEVQEWMRSKVANRIAPCRPSPLPR